MAMNNYQWQSSSSRPVKQGVKELELEKIEPVRAEDKKKSPVREYQPPIIDPARLRHKKVDQQFGKFLDLFKQLHINLSFVEAISQMPKYVKFLKEILSNKRRLEDLGLVTLKEECSAILQNKLPVKRCDPGSFIVPCVIGELPISGALADLGASINLMPTSLFDRLGLSEPKPTRMSIQLADRTIKIPRGIVENVLIKVDKFIFPVDFIVMDMEDESVVPLILGRPFLATSRAVIDVCNGKLQLRVDDETITFDLATSMRHSLDYDDTIFFMDVLDDKVKPSIEDPPVLELKELPKHLSYAYLDEAKRLPVIMAANLTLEEREMTLSSLRKYLRPTHIRLQTSLKSTPVFARTRS
ncbi:uncharacterized protein LOC125369292 [Ricinus communis]|uniref:uncharacterized protein LOC125369292 n=1 Tax=Ricinus communis TaxID=3988 RepID=UPI00201AC6DB|nr:uncharacterized protein LOC125369292 [Ricinus communis]